jgi:hypothetical protein
MESTILLSKDYLVASLLLSNYYYNHKNYITMSEYYLYERKVIDLLSENNNLKNYFVFSNNLETDYFIETENKYILNKNINIIDIQNRFMDYIPFTVIKTIFNSSLAKDILDETKEEQSLKRTIN